MKRNLLIVLTLVGLAVSGRAQLRPPTLIDTASCVQETQGLYCPQVYVHDGGRLSFRVNPPDGSSSDISLTYVQWIAVKARVQGSSDNSYSFDADSPLGHFHMLFTYQWDDESQTWILVFNSGWIQGK